MDLVILIWLFAAAVTLHNIEEALLLPKWSQTAGRWYRPVGACEFRFAVIVLTALLYAAAFLAVRGGKESVGAYLISGYALAMFLNVFTHVVPTIVMRRYAPGTATAVLLNLPVTFFLLREALGGDHVELSRFLWSGPLIVLALLASIPVLFAVGRGLCGPGRRAHDSTHA